MADGFITEVEAAVRRQNIFVVSDITFAVYGRHFLSPDIDVMTSSFLRLNRKHLLCPCEQYNFCSSLRILLQVAGDKHIGLEGEEVR